MIASSKLPKLPRQSATSPFAHLSLFACRSILLKRQKDDGSANYRRLHLGIVRFSQAELGSSLSRPDILWHIKSAGFS
jgi:hypothetical protein